LFTAEIEQEGKKKKDKEEYLEALKENADIYKKNFKKVVKLMVDDLWKQKNAAVLKEYGDPTAVNYTYGSYFYDNYVGPYYYVQEQQRLRNIVRGRMGESITKARSGEYLSRTGGLDLARSMVVSKPKVNR